MCRKLVANGVEPIKQNRVKTYNQNVEIIENIHFVIPQSFPNASHFPVFPTYGDPAV